jgi:hypothetical protein
MLADVLDDLLVGKPSHRPFRGLRPLVLHISIVAGCIRSGSGGQ